jgi:hypothetical protein
MGVLTPFRRSWQERNVEAIQAKPDHALEASGSRLTQVLASISAAGLIIASAGLGAIFAFGAGKEHGLLMAGLMTTFAVALELSKPIAVSSAFTAFRSWAIVRGLALFLLAAVAIAYSLTAELTLLASSRGDLVAKREAAIETRDDQRQRAREARADLATLAPSRTVEEARADIIKLLAAYPQAGDCKTFMANASARWVCPKVQAHEGEIARAKRRAELQAVVDRNTEGKTTVATVRSADPGSAALATYLGTLGFRVSATTLTDWLVLIPVLALEIGAALSVLLVQSVGGGHRPSMSKGTQQPATTPEPRSESVDSLAPEAAPRTPAPLNAAASAKSGAKRRSTRIGPERLSTRRLGNATVGTKEGAQSAIVDTLRSHGGRMEGASVRGLAALIGGQKSNVHNALVALIAAGVVAKFGGALVLQG